MQIKCGQCGKLLKEGDEVSGICVMFYHEIPSRISFSTSTPHDIIANSLAHVDCPQGGEYQ